jgi:hypothetical protein
VFDLFGQLGSKSFLCSLIVKYIQTCK